MSYFSAKNMLFIPIRTAVLRRFYWVEICFGETQGKKKILLTIPPDGLYIKHSFTGVQAKYIIAPDKALFFNQKL